MRHPDLAPAGSGVGAESPTPLFSHPLADTQRAVTPSPPVSCCRVDALLSPPPFELHWGPRTWLPCVPCHFPQPAPYRSARSITHPLLCSFPTRAVYDNRAAVAAGAPDALWLVDRQPPLSLRGPPPTLPQAEPPFVPLALALYWKLTPSGRSASTSPLSLGPDPNLTPLTGARLVVHQYVDKPRGRRPARSTRAG